VLTEGAAQLVGSTLRPDQVESLDQMAEVVLLLCDCRPQLTGQAWVSLDLLRALGRGSVEPAP
jgi:citronellol/citronellal dehydrogenase